MHWEVDKKKSNKMKNWEKGRNQEKEGKRDERKNGKEKIQHISNQNSKMKF